MTTPRSRPSATALWRARGRTAPLPSSYTTTGDTTRRPADAPCDRVLGLALQRVRPAEHRVRRDVAQRDHVARAEAAFGERAGLVEDDRVEVSCALEAYASGERRLVSRAAGVEAMVLEARGGRGTGSALNAKSPGGARWGFSGLVAGAGFEPATFRL